MELPETNHSTPKMDGLNRPNQSGSQPDSSRNHTPEIHPTPLPSRLVPAQQQGENDPAEPYEYVPGADSRPEGPARSYSNPNRPQSQKPTLKQSMQIRGRGQIEKWEEQSNKSKNPQKESFDALKKTQLPESHDPRAVAANLADEYLHIGAKLGSALWLIWGLICLLTLPAVIIGVGLIPGIVFNILLFSPKTVYRFSEILLDFVGVGEVMAAADEAGLGKVKITLKDWQKGLILLYDAIAAAIFAFMLFTILISVCYVTQPLVTQAGLKVASVVTGDSAYSSLSALCSSITN